MTSRLGDCGVSPIVFGRLRADETGFGYFDGATPVLLRQDAWMERLRARLPEHGGRVLLYVHGYYNSFGSATDRAGYIWDETRFDGPAIAFAWPSHARLSRYNWDEENALWTQLYFRELLLDLLYEPRIAEIVLVAHSMGNRILLRSLLEADEADPRRAASKIRNVILASPDVDRAIFERDYLPVLARGDRRTTIYVSRVDSALRSSWAMHGYVRTGDSGCTVGDVLRAERRARCFVGARPPLQLPANVTVVETSLVRGRLIGHADFVESTIARRDLCRVLHNETAFPERRPAGAPRPNVFFLFEPPPPPSPCPPVPAGGR